MVTRLDGGAFAGRVRRLLGAYAPETSAVQLNLLGSHDSPRVLSMLGGDREAMELATLLQTTLPGAPCIYYGDEVGVQGGIDPDSRRAFPWDRSRWDGILFESVRSMVAARHAEPALRADEVSVADASGPAIALRRGAGGPLAVVGNPGEEAVRLRLGEAGAARQVLAVGREGAAGVGVTTIDGTVEALVPPRTGAIIRLA